jgi:hypothetical protein
MSYKDPEKRRQAKRKSEQQRRARRRALRSSSSIPGETVQTRSVMDLLLILEEQINAVRKAEGVDVTERARCLAYLIASQTRLLELSIMDSRMKAIEERLKLGDGNELEPTA